MLFKFLSFFLFMATTTSWGAESLSYSGRLVNADGSPVAGNVNLKVELAYTDNTTTPLCTQSFTNVPLSNGVFHLKLNFTCSDPFEEILENISINESIAIRITDETNLKTYSYQALHSMPMAYMSNVAKKLVQLGATNGQVLTWDNGEWKPLAPAAAESGSIGTTELADGSVTNPKLASGIDRAKLADGTANYVLVNDGTGNFSESQFLTINQGGTGATTVAGIFTNLGLGTAATADLGLVTGNALAFDDVKFCLATEKLMMTAAPTVQWICVPENTPDDTTKLPLAGGVMSGTIDMNTNRIIGLPTPTTADEAVNKSYVDTLSESKWKTNVSDIHFDTGNVGIGTSTPAEKLDVVGNIALTGSIRLRSGTNYVELKAPTTLGSNLILNLPDATGSVGNALITDGFGNLSWSEVATNSTAVGGDLSGSIDNAQIKLGAVASAEIADATITNTDIANTTITYGKLSLIDGDIPEAKVNGLTTALSNKEPTIAAGTAGQYWSANKTWQTLDTSAVAEASNLYFTEDRVRGTDLAGLSIITGAISSTDTVLGALGKLAANQGNYVLKAGDTMSGVLNMGTNKIIGLADPTGLSDAANKNYVDAQITATASKWTANGANIHFSTGKVGIGVEVPQAQLEIAGDGTETRTVWIKSQQNNMTAPEVNQLFLYNTFDGGKASIGLSSNQNGGQHHRAVISGYMDPNYAGVSTAGNLGFITRKSDSTYVERLTIDSEGNVGIGTTNPSVKLDVVGADFALGTTDSTGSRMISLDADRNLNLRAGKDTTAGVWVRDENSQSGIRFYSASHAQIQTYGADGVTPSQLHLNPFGGNVGIGTIQPNSKLTVFDSSVAEATITGDSDLDKANLNLFELGTAGSESGFQMQFDGGTGINKLFINSYSTGTAVTRMSIDRDSGNIGIGTTTPVSEIDMDDGSIFFMKGADYNGIYFGQKHTDALPHAGEWAYLRQHEMAGQLELGSDLAIDFYETDERAHRVRFDMNTGRVGIGTAAPTYTLHVVGTAGLSTGTAWTNASDRRLKDIQGDYQHGLEEILKLNTVKYRYKKDNPLDLPSDKEVVGFIAQEVQEVIPEAVNEREDGFLELNVDPIHWAAVNAIQELNEKQNACTTKAAKINRTIASLHEEVAELREKDQKKDQEIEALKEENKAIKAFLCSQNASAPFCP